MISQLDIVDQTAWQAAHEALLAKEKRATRERDALAAERRRLPLMRVDKPYRFQGPDGEAGLTQLDVPVCDGVELGPHEIVDGPLSRAAAAALFEVSTEQLELACRQEATAHEDLGVVFTPFQQWWHAFGTVFPMDLGSADLVLLGRHR